MEKPKVFQKETKGGKESRLATQESVCVTEMPHQPIGSLGGLPRHYLNLSEHFGVWVSRLFNYTAVLTSWWVYSLDEKVCMELPDVGLALWVSGQPNVSGCVS